MEYDVNETITFGIISWIDRYKQHVKRFCWCCGCHYCYHYCVCVCVCVYGGPLPSLLLLLLSILGTSVNAKNKHAQCAHSFAHSINENLSLSLACMYLYMALAPTLWLCDTTKIIYRSFMGCFSFAHSLSISLCFALSLLLCRFCSAQFVFQFFDFRCASVRGGFNIFFFLFHAYSFIPFLPWMEFECMVYLWYTLIMTRQ